MQTDVVQRINIECYRSAQTALALFEENRTNRWQLRTEQTGICTSVPTYTLVTSQFELEKPCQWQQFELQQLHLPHTLFHDLVCSEHKDLVGDGLSLMSELSPANSFFAFSVK